MGELTMETLAKRLGRLERENRCLKLAGALVLVLVAAVVLMGQGTSDFPPPGKPGMSSRPNTLSCMTRVGVSALSWVPCLVGPSG